MVHTEQWTNGNTDRWMSTRRKDRLTDGWKIDVWMDKQTKTDGNIDRRTEKDAQMDRLITDKILINGNTDRWMSTWRKDRLTDG
jgi:hypothetical protein